MKADSIKSADSRMDYFHMLQAAQRFIEENDHFLVVSHLHPDGDAISSTLAIGWILNQLGKNYTLYNDDPIPGKFKFLWNHEQIRNQSATEMASIRYERVIAVDCADFSRVGQAVHLFADPYLLLNIDHHSTNHQFGQVNIVRTEAAATAEIIYDLIVHLGLNWDADIAACIYTGLLTDTGGFRYSNTTAKVLAIASEMMSYGADGSKLSERLLEKMSFPQFQLLQKALASINFAFDRKAAWVVLTQEDYERTGAMNEDSEGIVNYALNIEGVHVGMLFKEISPGEVKVSLRSSGAVNVAELAMSLGGGGHVRASGCTLHCSLSEAVTQILNKLGDKLL